MKEDKKSPWLLVRDEIGIFWAFNRNTGEKIKEEEYHFKMKTLKEKLEYLHEIDFVPSHINDAVKDAVLEFEEYLDKQVWKKEENIIYMKFKKIFGDFEELEKIENNII